jgi:ketopantoate reductase
VRKFPPPHAKDFIKICIYGAGAIGGYLGVQLARAGADVSLVARGAHLAAMRERGLKLVIGDEQQRSPRLLASIPGR